MIISKQRNQLVLIRQDEHDDQCGELARLWGNERFEQLKHHEAVSFGIENHDIGWKKPDDEVVFNEAKKRPMNFTEAQLPQHVEFYEKGYRAILEKDPYAAMLLGMHWIGLYTSRLGYDPTFTYKISDDLSEFMNSTITRIEKEFAEIKLQYWTPKQVRSEFEDHIWMGYEFFQVIDRMSLFMSLNDSMVENEVQLGPIRTSRKAEPVHITLKAKGNGTVIMDPFPFAQEFEAVVPAKRIEDREYSNHEDAKEAVEKAEKEPLAWKVLAK